MQTRLSSKGQVVLPRGVRERLGLRAGETFDVAVEEDRVILKRSARATPKLRIASDPQTGLPMLAAPKMAPPLTSAQVKELLSDFP